MVRMVLLVMLLAILPGCGGDAGIPTVEVDAKITIGGKAPGQSASIQVGPKDENLPTLSGFMASDGSAIFWTNGSQEEPDGLPVGEHTLVFAMDPMSPGQIPAAKPYTLKVEAAGTLTIDMEPGPKGGGLGMGAGTPGR